MFSAQLINSQSLLNATLRSGLSLGLLGFGSTGSLLSLLESVVLVYGVFGQRAHEAHQESLNAATVLWGHTHANLPGPQQEHNAEEPVSGR